MLDQELGKYGMKELLKIPKTYKTKYQLIINISQFRINLLQLQVVKRERFGVRRDPFYLRARILNL